MRIFILLLIGIIITGCQRPGSDLRADLNLNALTMDSEEAFRNLPEILKYKERANKHTFTTRVPLDLAAQRFLYCTDKQNKLTSSLWLVSDGLQTINYKNTYVTTASRPLTGYSIWELWELDALSDNLTKVTLYPQQSFLGISTEKIAKIWENYIAKGISGEDSIMHFACKF
jgi:hypothetical protein